MADRWDFAGPRTVTRPRQSGGMGMFRKGVAYLDNNGTTEMPKIVRDTMQEWTNRGNPSAGYQSANETRQMMGLFRKYIGRAIGADICCDEDRDSDSGANAVMRADGNRFKIIITSGASEANAMAITGIVGAAARKSALLPVPNIAISAVEHKSIIACAKGLEVQGRATVTYIPVGVNGSVDPAAVEAAIGITTCIVCVMAANNETGAINDIAAIGEICRRRGVHFHCDGVQMFGKIPPQAENYDSLAISFHKLHGPPGVGALCVRQSAKIEPLIWGSQNEGLRGGTENVPGIAASFVAARYNFVDRAKKNIRMLYFKQYIVGELIKTFPVMTYEKYVEVRKHNAAIGKNRVTVHDVLPTVAARALVDVGLADPLFTPIVLPRLTIVLISTMEQSLPNTLLLSVVREAPPDVCNTSIKEQLESRGVIISVGSACNTADPKASHVLYAIDADAYIRRGCLRISIGDINTKEDIDHFLTEFIRIVTAVRDA